MVEVWIVYPTVILVSHLVVTFVYCFWFVYLLQDVINKRACYKAALLRMQEPNDTYQQQVVHNSETKYIQTLYLFIINITEWLALTFVATAFIYLYFKIGLSCSSMDNPIYNSEEEGSKTNCFLHTLRAGQINSPIYSHLIIFGYNLILLSLTLIASLCNYLTARYARMSWIKSNRIPYFIVLVLVIMLVAQISTLFCFLILIVRLIHFVITAIAFAVGIHQYRRLRMVIQWIVVDLEISQTDHNSLIKFKRMNKRFKILFTVLWLGIVFFLISIFLGEVQVGTQLALQLILGPNKYHSLCTLHINYIPHYVTLFSNQLMDLLCLVGLALVYAPYICSGLYTASVLLWRRVRGRTGFETHYPNHLKTALIPRDP